jgi:hypothetical protein
MVESKVGTVSSGVPVTSLIVARRLEALAAHELRATAEHEVGTRAITMFEANPSLQIM